ncbi:MAG TPA: hypothetical protein VIR78_00875 [Malonomonas sp.]
MTKTRDGEKRREQKFTNRPATKIWCETPAADNPYIAEKVHCHGYNLMELMQKRSFPEVLFLLFKGELPSADQVQLLEQLMIALLNPGPRHPATRAAMNTGIGKSDYNHILPVALSILGGEHLGSGAIERCVRFFNKTHNSAIDSLIEEQIKSAERPAQGDWHPLPGFGSYFGGIDLMTTQIATQLATLPGAGKALKFGVTLAEQLRPYNLGWLTTGVAAAVFADFKFQPKHSAGIFQLLCAPGLLAHGMEMLNKPITAMPFQNDEDYIIED